MMNKVKEKEKIKYLFEKLMLLTNKSIKLDPWSKKRGLYGYCEELKCEVDEVIAAKDANDYENLKEELGDVLLDWCHACALAEIGGYFTTEEVIDDVIKKIQRRKPFLAENRKVEFEEARMIWKNAKEQEKTNKNKIY
jgi:NTP pyrophosphatase (non-canonical NTP hydrolase)